MTHWDRDPYSDKDALKDAEHIFLAIKGWQQFSDYFGLGKSEFQQRSIVNRIIDLQQWVKKQALNNNKDGR